MEERIDPLIEFEDFEEKEVPEEHLEDPIRAYLKQISQIPLLSKEEEVSLAKKIEEKKERLKQIEKEVGISTKKIRSLLQKEDKKLLPSPFSEWSRERLEGLVAEIDECEKEIATAKKKFIESNLRLVVSIAKKYSAKKLSLLDLIDEGNLGLMKAVEKFDYKQGYRFSTYATWWIRHAIIRAVADQSRTIRVPVYMVEMISRCIKAIRMLSQTLGRDPTWQEVAEHMGVDMPKIMEIIKAAQEPSSLEAPIGENGESQLQDMIEDHRTLSPQRIVFLEMLHAHVEDLLEQLTEKERQIIRLRYGLGEDRSYTLEEVGKRLGITRERVRQIEAKALQKLRALKVSEELHDFLEEE